MRRVPIKAYVDECNKLAEPVKMNKIKTDSAKFGYELS